jgi:predicted dinucleotide-binding enzyme
VYRAHVGTRGRQLGCRRAEGKRARRSAGAALLLDVFIAGDGEEAKAIVSKLAEDGGLRPVDVGPLKRARELEAAGLLHMCVQETLGTAFGSALKIVS